MAIAITLYRFSKKQNSTAQPSSGDVLYTAQCELKEGSSIVAPTLIWRATSATTDMSQANYAWIPFFGRYYWVTDWTYDSGLWFAQLKCDVLATYKALIGSESQYILRSSATYDINVVDTLYPAKVGSYLKMLSGTWADSTWTYGPETGNGSYIVGAINNNVAVNGTVVYYVLTGGEMAEFRSYMLGSIAEWSDITSFTGDVAKAFIDPFQYVVSCIWFPFTVPAGKTTTICFGYWESSLHASVLETFTRQRQCTVSRPIRDDASTLRGNWEYIEPFADYYLVAYPWGVIPIDGTTIDSAGIICNVTVDFVTGLAMLEVRKNAGDTTTYGTNIISTHTAQLGVQMQLSQITTSYSGLDTGGLGGLAKSAMGAIGSAIDAFLGSGENIASAAQAGMSHVSVSGTSGGVVSIPYSGACYLLAKFYDPVDEYNEEKGRPYCKIATPASLGGYMVVENGDIALPSTQQEQLEVQQFLEGGFYYE